MYLIHPSICTCMRNIISSKNPLSPLTIPQNWHRIKGQEVLIDNRLNEMLQYFLLNYPFSSAYLSNVGL